MKLLMEYGAFAGYITLVLHTTVPLVLVKEMIVMPQSLFALKREYLNLENVTFPAT